MKHKHHIIPKHMGGTDEPSNLFECSVEEHAELHLALYLEHGHYEDWIAANALSGQIEHDEARRLAASNYMKNRVVSQETRKKMSYYNTIRVHSKASREKRSDKMKGENNPFYGKTHNQDTVEKCRQGAKKQWERKLIWVNNGEVSRRVVESEIPEGFVRGRKKH